MILFGRFVVRSLLLTLLSAGVLTASANAQRQSERRKPPTKRPEPPRIGVPGSSGLIAPGAKVERLHGGFKFLEGPAADAEGNLVFSDPRASKVHRWSLDGQLTLVRDNTHRDNGLYFDANGDLVACATTLRKVIAIGADGRARVLAGQFGGKPFNSPNDLWIDPRGGIYFTDPRYGSMDMGPIEQDGEHVYYITPDRSEVRRVIDDLVRPNGVIGNATGTLLYVADHGGGKTYVYTIRPDGSLTSKKEFAPQGSDGMTMDIQGNVYLTGTHVNVYNPEGELIETIEMPQLTEAELPGRRRFESPANVTFAGADRKTLFICARTSLYSIRMNVRGHKTRFEP